MFRLINRSETIFIFLMFVYSFAYTINSEKPRFKFYYENNHNIYIESGYFFGNYAGPRFSLNYDGIVKNYQYLIFTLRIGAGYSFAQNKELKTNQEIIFPMSIHIQYTRVNTQAGGFRRYNIRNVFQSFFFKNKF